MDTIKESIGSGWAQTFELIFGNLEEAKKLWTGVNNVVSGFISKSSDARNNLLQTWHDSDKGRAALLDGFSNLFKAVVSVITPIKEAFRSIFPPATADSLIKFSTGFQKLTKSMIISDKTASKIKTVFTALFTVLKAGTTAIGAVFKIFASFVKVLLPIGGAGLTILDGISKGFIKIADAAGVLSDKLGELTKGLLGKAITGLGKLFTLVGEGLSHLNLAKVGGLLAGGGILAAGIKAVKFIDSLSERLDKLKDLFGKGGEGGGGLKDAIKDTLGSLSETLNQFQTSLKVGQLLTVAVAIGILAASCSTLANVPAKKLVVSVGAIGGLFTELGAASHLMTGANTKGIIAMSVAVAILAKAVKALSEVENMGKGLLGVGRTYSILYCV